jgi:hypothetical protein
MDTFPILVYVGCNALNAAGRYNEVERESPGSVKHGHITYNVYCSVCSSPHGQT